MKIPVYSAAVPNGEASGCGSACFCAARSEAAVRPAKRTPRAAFFGFILGTPLGHWLPFCDLHSPLCVGPVTYVSLPYRAFDAPVPPWSAACFRQRRRRRAAGEEPTGWLPIQPEDAGSPEPATRIEEDDGVDKRAEPIPPRAPSSYP